jgi:glucokinase
MIEWILADASFQGSVRFATVGAASEGLSNVRSFEATAYSTFTEAILSYVSLIGIDPRRAGCVLAVPGPAFPGTITIARSRWTFSRDGIARMFGGNAFLLNDMVAVAWSLLDPVAGAIEPFVGAPARLTEPGRRAVILLDDGVGAAAVMAEGGMVDIAPAEPGHMGFAPRNRDDLAILDELRPRHPQVSWERVLCDSTLLAADDVKWAAVAGEFVGDVLLSTAAWSGAVLTGRQALRLLSPQAKAAFTERCAAKSKYARQLAAIPHGIVRQRDPLAGCLAFLRRRVDQHGGIGPAMAEMPASRLATGTFG